MMFDICLRNKFIFLSVLLLGLSINLGAASEFWSKAESPNHFILLRHALAPGYGDPEDFDLEDPSTQRRLSEAGREQARKIGDLFRARGIESVSIYTSQWDRCLETAQLLNLGDVKEFPALNSFFQIRSMESVRMGALRNWLREGSWEAPLILVTHQVTITALTGYYPASGELVLVRLDPDQGFRVVSSLETR